MLPVDNQLLREVSPKELRKG